MSLGGQKKNLIRGLSIRRLAACLVFLSMSMGVVVVFAFTGSSADRSVTIVVDSEDGTVLSGLKITTTDGPCIVIRNSVNVTIRDSLIGPCGEQGVRVSNSSNVLIVDNYINPDHNPVPGAAFDKGDGIFVDSSSRIHIEGNYVSFGESNVELLGVSGAVVRGNVLVNPRGPFPRGAMVQVWKAGDSYSSNILVERNVLVASEVEFGAPEDAQDLLNFGYAHGVVARENYIEGGKSPSGCGLIVDRDVSNVEFLNNVLVNTGQCGIGIAGGRDIKVSGNQVANSCFPPACNIGAFIWDHYETNACTAIVFTNNTIVAYDLSGGYASFWNAGDCTDVTVADNIFGPEAASLLEPGRLKLPRPSLVPLPYENPAPMPPPTPAQK